MCHNRPPRPFAPMRRVQRAGNAAMTQSSATEFRNSASSPSSGSNRGSRDAAVITALAAVYLLWGSTYLAMRIGLTGFPPFLMAGVRFVMSGVLLLGFTRLRGLPLPKAAEWGGSAIVGVLLLGVGNGGVVFSEQTVSSGLAALGVATVPLFAALFGGIWRVWPTRREWLGLAIGFAGLILLNVGGGLRASTAGAVALVLASVAWAFGSVWSRRLPLPSPLVASGAQMLSGGVFLLLASALHHEHLASLPPLRPVLALLYLMFGAIAGFSAYVYLLGKVRPVLATSYAYVNPVIAVALGAALLREKITPLDGLSLLLILAGVALVLFAKKPIQKISA